MLIDTIRDLGVLIAEQVKQHFGFSSVVFCDGLTGEFSMTGAPDEGLEQQVLRDIAVGGATWFVWRKESTAKGIEVIVAPVSLGGKIVGSIGAIGPAVSEPALQAIANMVGVHWDRTQTWWEMVPAYHEYLSRCQFLLQRGVTVADVCFLAGEGAPHVFRRRPSATTGNPPDHGGYNFDGSAPETLLERAEVKNGKIIFPGATSHRILVLPEQRTMTPALLGKIKSLVRAGATVFGPPPDKSPSLQEYPKCDATIGKLAREIWGDCDGKTVFSHAFGKGRVVWQQTEVKPLVEYGDFAAVTNVLGKMGVAPDFASDGPIRFTHRRDGDTDMYFVANREPRAVETVCQFRVAGRQPELWNPETDEISPLIVYDKTPAGISVPLRFEANCSTFVVFRPQQRRFDSVVSFTRDGQLALPLTKPLVIKIQMATFGVPGDVARTRDVQTEVQSLANRGEVGFKIGKMVEGGDLEAD